MNIARLAPPAQRQSRSRPGQAVGGTVRPLDDLTTSSGAMIVRVGSPLSPPSLSRSRRPTASPTCGVEVTFNGPDTENEGEKQLIQLQAAITNGLVGDAALRRDAFLEHLQAVAPGITVVDVQDGQADRTISLNKAQGILQAHPDLAGFFATSDNATIAAP
ncbi:hypothetical protein G7085_19340 [Tessaracoccus sp. HDW20]|uniref:hypothetical protein n=1 Tax=Tessaracoccus coleopterorum TaxID=2714950 RepID=UPI0018D3C19A|nr:hypothetical protein [Tessaracoccus coleopterorum]NHB85969.1 hypothetical protein [Tessaracoccus coleopterorum]